MNLDELESRKDKIWPSTGKTLKGIDLNDKEQEEFFNSLVESARLIPFAGGPDQKKFRYYIIKDSK